MIKAVFTKEKIIADVNNFVRELYNKSRLGEIKGNKVYYSLIEALYLIEKKKISISDYKKKKLNEKNFIKKARRINPNFLIRFTVFKDLRNRGYIVKTALKFGADFRVYEKGKKPGEAHAQWVVYAVDESDTLTWRDFSAKNRVAHSTKKNLLIAVVDDEMDVTFYEISWIRP